MLAVGDLTLAVDEESGRKGEEEQAALGGGREAREKRKPPAVGWWGGRFFAGEKGKSHRLLWAILRVVDNQGIRDGGVEATSGKDANIIPAGRAAMLNVERRLGIVCYEVAWALIMQLQLSGRTGVIE